MKNKWGACACVVWLVLSLAIVVARASNGLPIDTNIKSILPNQTLASSVKAAMDRSGEVASNRVVFLVTDTTQSGLNVQAMASLKQKLMQGNLFADDMADMDGLGRWVFANREEILCEPAANLSDEIAQNIRKQALAKVYGVGAPITGDLLRADPFLLTLRLSECLSQGAALIPKNQSLLSGKLTRPAFALDTQAQVIERIGTWEEEWAPKGVELARTGAVFHAAHGANSAKTEMSFIGGIGIVGVVALFWFVFGRVTNVLAVASLIAFSCLSGFAATLLIFQDIHMLVLVFAAMLVGVVADYAVHAMATGVNDNWPEEKFRRGHLWRPMTVSMLTTAAGFAGLVFLGVPMFRQLAVFAIIGIFTAWALVLFVFLPLDRVPKNGREVLSFRWMRVLSFASKALPVSRTAAYVALGLGVITIGGFIFSRSLDDVREFQPRNKELIAQEVQLSQIVGSMSSQVFLVSEGVNLEEAKRREEAAIKVLGPDVTTFSLTRFDPSLEVRRSNRAALEDMLFSPYGRVHAAQLGVATLPPASNEVVDAAKPAWFEDLHVVDNGKHFLIARVSAPQNIVLSDTSIEGVTLVDMAGQYSQAFASYRVLAAWSLVAAVGVALLFVGIIYRNIRALSIVLTPAAAMLCGIYLPTLLGQPITFFSMAGAMVLFGVGVDYSAFMWESGRNRETWSKASVLVGGITTLLSMGLLALSETLPVRSFGITVALGVICALVFSTLPYYLASKDVSDAK
ncbi:MMPL family transporter [Hirschia litorea]|uniref:MMPL family transporter n=1 Tax=Hirschia litorea TaxID=1199156 RepID=A0ABW2IIF2_9PROT